MKSTLKIPAGIVMMIGGGWLAIPEGLRLSRLIAEGCPMGWANFATPTFGAALALAGLWLAMSARPKPAATATAALLGVNPGRVLAAKAGMAFFGIVAVAAAALLGGNSPVVIGAAIAFVFIVAANAAAGEKMAVVRNITAAFDEGAAKTREAILREIADRVAALQVAMNALPFDGESFATALKAAKETLAKADAGQWADEANELRRLVRQAETDSRFMSWQHRREVEVEEEGKRKAAAAALRRAAEVASFLSGATSRKELGEIEQLRKEAEVVLNDLIRKGRGGEGETTALRAEIRKAKEEEEFLRLGLERDLKDKKGELALLEAGALAGGGSDKDREMAALKASIDTIERLLTPPAEARSRERTGSSPSGGRRKAASGAGPAASDDGPDFDALLAGGEEGGEGENAF